MEQHAGTPCLMSPETTQIMQFCIYNRWCFDLTSALSGNLNPPRSPKLHSSIYRHCFRPLRCAWAQPSYLRAVTVESDETLEKCPHWCVVNTEWWLRHAQRDADLGDDDGQRAAINEWSENCNKYEKKNRCLVSGVKFLNDELQVWLCIFDIIESSCLSKSIFLRNSRASLMNIPQDEQTSRARK